MSIGEFVNIPIYPSHIQSIDLLSTSNPNTNASPNTNHREHPPTNNSSNNLPRLFSMESNITTSSLDYVEGMET